MAMTTKEQERAPSRTNPREQLERFGLVGAWILLIALFGALLPSSFLTWPNFSTMFGSQAVLVVVALGLTVSLTIGEFDLSIANVLVLASMVTAILTVYWHVPLLLALLVALALGAVVGAINGFLIVRFNIHSLIVTLGTGTFLQGITLWASNSNTISGIPMALVQAVIVKRLFGIPLAFYYAIVLCLLIWYLFQFTAVGRHMLFVGRGHEVARLSGIRVPRLRVSAMMASSVFGALAGILYTGTRGAADPSSGLSFMLPAFAAAFLGSTTISPGRFNPWGTVLAVYFLVTGITGLILLGVDTFVQDLFYGGALVLAVTVSQILRGRHS